MPSTFTPDQHVKAAWSAHLAGDVDRPDRVTATEKAIEDLCDRTWRAGRDMTRDERRLFDRYSRTLDAHRDERTARYATD